MEGKRKRKEWKEIGRKGGREEEGEVLVCARRLRMRSRICLFVE